MFVLLALLLELTGALPFVSTWRTTQANEAIVLPPIIAQTAVTVDWGDGTPNSNLAAAQSSFSFNHTYASAGLYNVSMDGQIYWNGADSKTTKEKLVDISSWGDGFLVQNSTSLFQSYPNLQVSASPDTQPKFLAGASLVYMFQNSSFNSPLNWDLTNVTSLNYMFCLTPLNQPINFRNTQGVQTITGMFQQTPFNQPFHFDASGLTSTKAMFNNASSFNQVVNLTNSSLLTDTSNMFIDAAAFNQPITFNTSSVATMSGMFSGAINFNQLLNFDTQSVTTMATMFRNAKKFNQPVNHFNTSQVTTMGCMFSQAESFNQPINFDAPKLTTASSMFDSASSFNQPVVMNTPNVTMLDFMFYNAVNFSSTVTFTPSTAQVTDMGLMFSGADWFTQDLSSWRTHNVTLCTRFCDYCGLPTFPSCIPCHVIYTVDQMSVCSTRAPTPQSSSPSSRAPSTGVPSSSAPSSASVPPSSSAPSSAAASVAPSINPSNSSSVSAATHAATASSALTWAMLLVFLVAALK